MSKYLNLSCNSLPISSITAVSSSLTPHAVELRPLSKGNAFSATGLSNARGLGTENCNGPRVDVNVVDVDLAVQVELRSMQQECI